MKLSEHEGEVQLIFSATVKLPGSLVQMIKMIKTNNEETGNVNASKHFNEIVSQYVSIENAQT